MAKEPKTLSYLSSCTVRYQTQYRVSVCVLRKRKEERKGESETRAIDRIVRSFEIRTKPSTQSNDQFGISLYLIFSIQNPKCRFDSCFFRLEF